jgi:hypothetical protein
VAITLQAIPKSRRSVQLELDDIPQDVKTAVVEAFDYGQKHPDERLSVTFGSQGDAETFLFQARSYARLAEPRLAVSGNTTRKGEARFTVTLRGADSQDEADTA